MVAVEILSKEYPIFLTFNTFGCAGFNYRAFCSYRIRKMDERCGKILL